LLKGILCAGCCAEKGKLAAAINGVAQKVPGNVSGNSFSTFETANYQLQKEKRRGKKIWGRFLVAEAVLKFRASQPTFFWKPERTAKHIQCWWHLPSSLPLRSSEKNTFAIWIMKVKRKKSFSC